MMGQLHNDGGHSGGDDLSLRLERLQERHSQLTAQTAEEIRELRAQMQATSGQTDLERHVEELRHTVANLEAERNELRLQLHGIHSSISGILQVAPSAPPPEVRRVVRVPLTYQPASGAPVLIPAKEQLPVARRPTPALPMVTDPELPLPMVTAAESVPALPEKAAPVVSLPPSAEPPKKKAKQAPVHRIVKRALLTLLLCGTGFVVAAQGKRLVLGPDTGQVAGVSTIAATAAPVTTGSAPSFGEYPESRADLPFDDTTWATFKSPDFGVTFAYPSNTSNLVHALGGNNIWLLRNDGYLAKISKIEGASGLTLDQYWDTIKADYETDYAVERTSLKGHDAWFAKTLQPTAFSLSTYFVQSDDEIFSLSLKDESEATPDGLRVKRIRDTFGFGN